MTHRALQHLLGRLAHVASCVPQARRFMQRLLASLCGLHAPREAAVDAGLRADVAREGNGVHLLPPPARPVWVIECDSCLTGGGAYTSVLCYGEAYSPEFMAAFPAIHELEAINLLVAVRNLVPSNSAGIVVVVNTDNAVSAAALSSGRMTDATLGACAREIWLLVAIGNYDIEDRHKPGSQLQFADALSRA